MVTNTTPYEPRFAAIEWKPKASRRRSRFYRVRDYMVIVWHEEDWNISRTLGSSYTQPHQSTVTGASPKGEYRAWYDVRVMAYNDREVIKAMDKQIEAIRQARQAYLDEHFREWQIATREDCSQIYPTLMTEAQAKSKAREANKKQPKSSTLDGERRLVNTVNSLFLRKRA